MILNNLGRIREALSRLSHQETEPLPVTEKTESGGLMTGDRASGTVQDHCLVVGSIQLKIHSWDMRALGLKNGDRVSGLVFLYADQFHALLGIGYVYPGTLRCDGKEYPK